jgi:hypothetical protein
MLRITIDSGLRRNDDQKHWRHHSYQVAAVLHTTRNLQVRRAFSLRSPNLASRLFLY